MSEEVPNYERIWLQPFAGDGGGHTWCSERMENEDIEYVRADIAAVRLQSALGLLERLQHWIEDEVGAEMPFTQAEADRFAELVPARED